MEYNDNIEDDICTHTLINDDEVVKKIQLFHDIQHKIFTEITSAVSGDNGKKLFFIDGPRGTGKSYLLNTLIMFLNNKNYQGLAVAWTGIAVNLLINGKTAHTAFKLRLNINERSTCNVSKNSTYANYIKSMDLG